MILIVIIVFRVADYIVHIDPLQVDLRHSDKKPAELICIHNLLDADDLYERVDT